jgi:type II secretory pathway pseudopilin PulG
MTRLLGVRVERCSPTEDLPMNTRVHGVTILSSVVTRARELFRADDGITIIEVLVVGALGLVVLGATLAPLVTTQRAEIRATAWQDQLQATNVQEAGMLHEIRQAYGILSTTPNSIDFLISTNGTRQQVQYECDVAQTGTVLRQCVRLQAAVGGTLPPASAGTPVITNLLDGTPTDPVFGFAPDGFNPTYVTVHLEVPSSGGSAYGLSHPIVINDGAYLRNPAVTT